MRTSQSLPTSSSPDLTTTAEKLGGGTPLAPSAATSNPVPEALGIEHLMPGFTPADFVRNVFRKSPRQWSGSKVLSSLDLAGFERVLWERAECLPNHLWAIRSGTPRFIARRSGREYFRWAIDEYRGGSTLVFSELDRVYAPLTMLISELTNSLQAQVTAAGILSASGAEMPSRPGEGCRILIQRCGRTRWQLPDTKLVPEMFTLAAGDVLYLPSDTTAIQCTDEGPSLVCALTVEPFTRRDYVGYLAEVAAERDVEARRAITGIDRAIEERISRAWAGVRSLAEEERIRLEALERMKLTRVCTLRPIPGYHFEAAAKAESLRLDSRLRVPRGMVFSLLEREDRVHLYMPGLGVVDERRTEPGGLVFPVSAAYLLRNIMMRTEIFTALNLPPIYSERSRLTVLRRLAEEGALIVEPLG